MFWYVESVPFEILNPTFMLEHFRAFQTFVSIYVSINLHFSIRCSRRPRNDVFLLTCQIRSLLISGSDRHASTNRAGYYGKSK